MLTKNLLLLLIPLSQYQQTVTLTRYGLIDIAYHNRQHTLYIGRNTDRVPAVWYSYWQRKLVTLQDVVTLHGLHLKNTITRLEGTIINPNILTIRLQQIEPYGFSTIAQLEFEDITSINPLIGDFDLDQDVDQTDFGLLQRCIGADIFQNCGYADINLDNTIDYADVAILLDHITGSK